MFEPNTVKEQDKHTPKQTDRHIKNKQKTIQYNTLPLAPFSHRKSILYLCSTNLWMVSLQKDKDNNINKQRSIKKHGRANGQQSFIPDIELSLKLNLRKSQNLKKYVF